MSRLETHCNRELGHMPPRPICGQPAGSANGQRLTEQPGDVTCMKCLKRLRALGLVSPIAGMAQMADDLPGSY